MSSTALLLLAIFLPLCISPLLLWGVRQLKYKIGWIALPFPILSAYLIFLVGQQVGWGSSYVVAIPWVPELGISMSFLVDGVSLFFGFVVTIMGALVCLYAIAYLNDPLKEIGRFYSYLLFFMFAMLGTVFSNNLIGLFIFWELTGIASFLLIGFYFHKDVSRKGAFMALIVTGSTGLVMLVGLILTGQLFGTYEISNLLQMAASSHLTTALLAVPLPFIMIGAFGKSAQFPFHFWLPNAMAAPTPVSAYLHSAAMVKLGIFLTARFYPLFIHSDLWAPLLITIGFLTMVVGAVYALLSHDIKALLAYTTISQLGFLIGFYGLGIPDGVQHDFLHIVNHVFYKGALFMIAGIAIHAFHTQDLRKMGGFFKHAPIAAISCILAAAAMAGIPLTSGFISKELMLGEMFGRVQEYGGISILIPIGLFISATCLVACGLRLIVNVFLGKLPESAKKNFHAPSILFQLPPFLLALGALFFGLFPDKGGFLLSSLSVQGLHLHHPEHLALWHGFNGKVLFSASVVGLGTLIFFAAERANWVFANIPKLLRFDHFFNASLGYILTFSDKITSALRTDKPKDYLAIIILAFVSMFAYALRPFFGPEILPFLFLDSYNILESVIAVLIAVFALGVIIVKPWITRLISMSVVGFLITFYFVLYRAPDLALTQMMIEAVTLVLILYLLGRIPTHEEEKAINLETKLPRKMLNLFLSISVGTIMTTLVLLATRKPMVMTTIGDYFIKNTNSLAGGSNAVNTILVDFRGFDTMGEISVLVIALLGALGLLMHKQSSKSKGIAK